MSQWAVLLPQSPVPFDQVDYADLVTVAVLQSHANTEHPYAKLDWSKVHAFERLGLSSDMDVSEAINLDDDISSLLL